jgi:hypothetical protein
LCGRAGSDEANVLQMIAEWRADCGFDDLVEVNLWLAFYDKIALAQLHSYQPTILHKLISRYVERLVCNFTICCSDGNEDLSDWCDVVFIHQSRWQQRMLQLYGSDICLIDATYRTTAYDLPLVCLAVATNVGFVNVASMLLVDEKAETVAAGLRKLAAWNPDWRPKYFMSDFHEAQISALESTFPGVYSE